MTSQNLLQKTSFSTTNEFIAWLELVNEIADKPVTRIAVKPDTLDMLIREWSAMQGYSWMNKKYVPIEQGLTLTVPWGTVNVEVSQ